MDSFHVETGGVLRDAACDRRGVREILRPHHPHHQQVSRVFCVNSRELREMDKNGAPSGTSVSLTTDKLEIGCWGLRIAADVPLLLE